MKYHFHIPVLLYKLPSLGLILICLIMAGLTASCDSPESKSEETPEPSDELPTGDSIDQPPATWSADGVISSREYLSEMAYGNYELHWKNDDDFIYVAMKAETSGWISLGIQPGTGMKNADMIFGFVKDGEVTVIDLFATDNFGSHPPDIELGGTSDIVDFGGIETDGFTVIEFKRPLDTGDQYDNELSSGENRIIWSYGSSDSLTARHVNRGYGEINIIR